MAHIPLMMGGDGGADLDLITIVSADVRKGKTLSLMHISEPTRP